MDFLFAGAIVFIVIFACFSVWRAMNQHDKIVLESFELDTQVESNTMQEFREFLASQPVQRIPDYSEQIKAITKALEVIPGKVLESINGSTSNHKGKLAELIAYLNLKASYDRIIPLGNIVDFICIKFPTETSQGEMVFMDIKNGKSARLSDDQKQLQKIIQAHNIKFLKIKIDTDEVDAIQAISQSNTDI